MRACKCGNLKIEHRELNLCASCNRLRRAGESLVVAKQRKPIAQVSALRNVTLKVRQVAYKQVKAEQKECAACGTKHRLTPSHVLTQKQFPRHAVNPVNIVVLCQDCHCMWEHDKQSFRVAFPDVWSQKMHIMQELEPAYYQQFKAKNGV